MLAKGRGYIKMEDFRDMFGLPEDTEITNIRVQGDLIEFDMLSAEESSNGFMRVENINVLRKYRLVNRYKAQVVTKIFETPEFDAKKIAESIHDEVKKAMERRGKLS